MQYSIHNAVFATELQKSQKLFNKLKVFPISFRHTHLQ